MGKRDRNREHRLPGRMKVREYICPVTFAFYRQEGLKRGFTFMESGPLVRSSYYAERHIRG
ncbi:MAG: hypothetical protein ACP5D1_08615 [Bacteroidales bacterium]